MIIRKGVLYRRFYQFLQAWFLMAVYIISAGIIKMIIVLQDIL